MRDSYLGSQVACAVADIVSRLTRVAPKSTLGGSPKINRGMHLEGRVMTDTEPRGIIQWALIGLGVAAVFCVPRPLLAESPRSRVIWARADHAYVALAGGERAEEGD